jgi:hypothetical protein
MMLSPSLALRGRTPKDSCGRVPPEDDDACDDWLLYLAVSERDRCVVALETSCGRLGLLPCDDVGREPSSFGRGGRGGGVSSVEGPVEWLREDFIDVLCITLSVGLVKSCSWTWSPF